MTGFWSLEYRYKAGNPSSHHLDWVEGAWSINLTPFARVLVVRAKGRATGTVNGRQEALPASSRREWKL